MRYEPNFKTFKSHEKLIQLVKRIWIIFKYKHYFVQFNKQGNMSKRDKQNVILVNGNVGEGIDTYRWRDREIDR